MSIEAHSRRNFLAGSVAAAALAVSGTTALSGESAFATPHTLSSVISDVGKPIPYGAAAQSDALLSDLPYRDAIVANCQLMVPESELKWLELRPTRDEYRFEKADAIVDFARQTIAFRKNGREFRFGHGPAMDLFV